MPTLTGNLTDVVGSTTSGRIEVWATTPRKDGNDTVGTGVGRILVEDGVIQPETISPGPTSFYVSVGTWVHLYDNVVVPDDASVDFFDVIESSISYEPAVVSQVRADRIAAEAAALAAIEAAASVEGPEHFHHSLAGATNGMALPAVSNSGHALTWSQLPANNGSTGQINGRGGFWSNPASAPSAVYMAATLDTKPRWGRMRFAILPMSSPNGTACIAIPSKPNVISGGGAPLTMAVHYRTTRSSWAMTVWDNGAEQVLAQGVYSPQLVGDPNRPVEYEIAFVIGEGDDADTIWFRTCDGAVHKAVDPRIASLGGTYLFAESYCPASTDDIVAVLALEGGAVPPIGLLDASSVTFGDFSQQLSYRPVKATNDRAYTLALDEAGNLLPAGGRAELRFNTTTGNLTSVLWVPPA